MKELQFPSKYYENNIVYTQGNEPWAYFELVGYEYDYLSENRKVMISREFENLFAQIKVDTHLLVLPKFHSVREIQEEFKTTITGPLKDQAMLHAEEVVELVEAEVGSDASDFRFYLGVKLPKADRLNLTMKNIIASFKDIANQIFSKMGMDDTDIPEYEIDYAESQESQFFSIIEKYTRSKRVDEDDLQWLIRRNFYRSIGLPPEIKGFKPQYKKTKNGRHPASLLPLTEGIVDAKSEPRKIILSQAVGGQLKTSHCAFLTVSYMPTEGLFDVGTEWIYAIKNLDFLPEISIRTDTIEYRKVKEMITNKKKEIKDQEDHAAKTNNEAAFEVVEKSVLIKDLEAFTNITKSPQINVSIVFCVSAPNALELERRIKALEGLYADYFSFQLTQPISDQFKLFNEFLPGARRYVTSYVQMMEPAALAAGMFAATSQIGDKKGFPIGIQNGRAVYMNPKEYTQGDNGEKARSLSAVFVGSKGSGKSFGGNVIAYNAVLSGAKALIIDPKGDRTLWRERLLAIGHEVNVITLEANESNAGRLDPFLICRNLKDAESLALKIMVYLTKINQQKERSEWIAIRNAVRDVAAEPKPCMDKVIQKLLADPLDKKAFQMGEYLESYKDLSFSSLIFGDGSSVDALNIENAINVLQIQNLKMPKKNKPPEQFDMEEMLSMAMMFPIGEFAHDFIKYDASVLKIVFIDESWFMEKTDIGADIIDRLQREGRARNAGVFRATQAISDVNNETKSLVGLKFIFQILDPDEAANALKFLGIEPNEAYIQQIQNFESGECFMQDIYGRIGIVRINHWFDDIFHAFDTRPPIYQPVMPEAEKELIQV